MLAADHLIAHISSNPLIARPLGGDGRVHRAERLQALITYLESLGKTREMDLDAGAPRPRRLDPRPRSLIDERLRLHERRAEKIAGLIAEHPQHRARDRPAAVGQRGGHPGLPDPLGGARPRRPAAPRRPRRRGPGRRRRPLPQRLGPAQRCSISLRCTMFARSCGSSLATSENHASRISAEHSLARSAAGSARARWRRSSAAPRPPSRRRRTSAARTPGTLFAAIDAPVPVQQHAIRAVGAAAGHVPRNRLRGPRPVAALARRRSLRGRSPRARGAPAPARAGSRSPSALVGGDGDPHPAAALRSAARSTRHLGEHPVQALVLAELGVEGHGQPVPLARSDRHDRPRRARISTSGPCSAIHGARMKIAAHRAAVDPARASTSASKLRIWRPNALRSAAHVHDPEMLAVEHDQPRAGAEDGSRRRRQLAQRLRQALTLDPQRHRRRLPAGDHEAVEALQVRRHADLARARAERAAACARVPRSRPAARERRSAACAVCTAAGLPAALGQELLP